MTPTDAPTLDEQIAWLRNEADEQRKYREAFNMKPHYQERHALAILASLEAHKVALSKLRDAVEALRNVSTLVDSASDRLLLLSEIEAIQKGQMKYPQDICNRVSKISVDVMAEVTRVLARIGEVPE